MRTMIATPAYDGRVDVRYADSLARTIALVPDTHAVFWPGEAIVQLARNALLQIAVEADVDQVFWIDADEGWEPADFKRIAEDPRDFVTGLVRQKSDKAVYCVREPDWDSHTVASCGMGFCKMSRNVVQTLWQKSKPYVQDGIERRMAFEVLLDGHEVISEDIVACRKWGGDIFYDPQALVAHVGTKVYFDKPGIA